MKIINSEEVDQFLWDHAQVMGNVCRGVHDPHANRNSAFVDETTGETIAIIYEDSA
jgi:hypothetical protein